MHHDPNNNSAASSQPNVAPAPHHTGPPAPPYAPPTLPSAGPSWALSATSGRWQWMPDAPQPPAPWTGQPGLAVVVVPLPFIIVPQTIVPCNLTPVCSRNDFSKPPPPPQPTPAPIVPRWRPPATPPPSHPSEVDRDDEWETPEAATDDIMVLFAPLGDTINHWAACTSR